MRSSRIVVATFLAVVLAAPTAAALAAPITVSPTSAVPGQTPAEQAPVQPNATRLENAESIYHRARQFALNLASRADELGLADVAASLREAVSSADDLFDQAVEAYQAGDWQAARAKFKEALSTLKSAVIEAIRSLREEGENLTGAGRVLASVRRLRRYMVREEAVLARMAAAGIDVSDPRAALNRAEEHLSNAVDLFSSGRYEEAKEEFFQAVREVKWVANWIKSHSGDYRNRTIWERVQRIISKVEKVKSRLSDLEDRLRAANRTDDADAVASAIAQLSSLEDHLRQAAESGDRQAAAEAVRQMYQVIRDLRRRLSG